MSMGNPDFLIIGAARSSTSALARFLDSQAGVVITDPKEPHFLAHANTTPTYGGPGDDFMMNSRVTSDPTEYTKLFEDSRPGVLQGEGSVTTFAFPEPSIENIDRYCPQDVKLIVCLRDPVERMFSSYLYLRSRQRETVTDFAEALALEQQRTDENWHHMWRYEALSRYDQLLPPFVEHFGDRLHICIAERLDGLASPEFKKIAYFLEMPAVDESIEFGQINSGGVLGQSVVGRAASKVIKNERLLEVAKSAVPRSVQERLYSKMFDRPTLDPDLAVELRRKLEPAVEVVEAHVGPLPEWRS